MMQDEEKSFYFGDDDPEKVPYEVMEVSKVNINQVRFFKSLTQNFDWNDTGKNNFLGIC